MKQISATNTPVATIGRWAVYEIAEQPAPLGTHPAQWLVVPVGHVRFYGRKDSALRHARKLNADDQALQ